MRDVKLMSKYINSNVDMLDEMENLGHEIQFNYAYGLHERFSKFVDDFKISLAKNRPCSRGLKAETILRYKV